MQKFFIGAFEKLVAVIIIVMLIGIVLAAVTFGAQQSALAGFVIAVAGSLNVILLGGMLYLFLGIYHNTRRTAEALEKRNGV